MRDQIDGPQFEAINRGFAATFRKDRLSVGLVAPIERYDTRPEPTMERHLERAKLADDLGFAALWLRDIPFNSAAFGDAGQIFDPFVYLGALAATTRRIALGVSSIVLPLRHPAHVAKAAASADALSNGRLILGIASGDRPEEYPAFDAPFEDRGARFRDGVDYIRRVGLPAAPFASPLGSPGLGLDVLPKPTGARLPLMITGSSRQSPEWIAEHGDGWMIYPRAPMAQARTVADWRARTDAVGAPPKPVMQPLYVDLVDDPAAAPQAIHLGLRLGLDALRSHLASLEAAGVNHVALNLRFNRADTESTVRRLADGLFPEFNA